MDQEQKSSRFFNWLYIPIIAPLIVIFFGSFITGKIIIQITGFQLSIGLSILVIFCIFIAMSISFYLAACRREAESAGQCWYTDGHE